MSKKVSIKNASNKSDNKIMFKILIDKYQSRTKMLKKLWQFYWKIFPKFIVGQFRLKFDLN